MKISTKELYLVKLAVVLDENYYFGKSLPKTVISYGKVRYALAHKISYNLFQDTFTKTKYYFSSNVNEIGETKVVEYEPIITTLKYLKEDAANTILEKLNPTYLTKSNDNPRSLTLTK